MTQTTDRPQHDEVHEVDLAEPEHHRALLADQRDVEFPRPECVDLLLRRHVVQFQFQIRIR